MKLRSDSRAVAASKTPVPIMLPASRAVSISNASSLLLRLPQELKDCIYHFVYGGIHILIEGNPYLEGFRLDACTKTNLYRDVFSTSRLPVASLKTCRQIYHEARNVLYSANTFQFANPRPLRLFLQRIDVVSHRSLAVQSLVLHVSVFDRNEERAWNNVFRAMAEDLKNLQHLHINVNANERTWYRDYFYSRRPISANGKSPFLRGLLELKELPLKTLEIVMDQNGGYDPMIRKVYIATVAQEQEWAQSMKSAILGTD